MEELEYKCAGWKCLIRTLCFAAIGVSAFANLVDITNPYNVGFGIVIGIFFGWLYKKFLIGFLGILNGKLKKEKGKKVIKEVVSDGMLFLVPFAIMLLVATYVLKWSMTGSIISAGIMAVGTAAAIEMGKRKGKQELRNTIATSIVSYAFSYLWTIGFVVLIRVPSWIEGGVKLVQSLLAGGGGSL